MYTNAHDQTLQVEVIRAILKERPDLRRDVVVIATEGGFVTLRGLVASAEDSQQLESLVRSVPNVKQVFCHVAIRTRKFRDQEALRV